MKREIAHIEGRFEGYDGLGMYYQRWAPSKSVPGGRGPQAAVIIVHGVGEHSSRYAHVGEHLAGLGFVVYAYDQRGHGRSGGRRGHIRAFDEYTLDLNHFIRQIKNRESIITRPASGRIVILGHSLGGLITLRFVMHHPHRPTNDIAGIILSSPALGLKMRVSLRQKVLGYSLNLIWPAFVMIDNGVQPAFLSHDRRVTRAINRDLLVHSRRTARFFVEFTKAQKETFGEPEKLTLPCLFLQAGDDIIVSAEAVKDFYDRVPAGKKSFKIYPSFYHEILNETRRDEVFKDIENWLVSLGEA